MQAEEVSAALLRFASEKEYGKKKNMAYNLQSLITILEQILNPEQTQWILDGYRKPQLESLLQKATSLQEILGKSWLTKMGKSLESQIRDTAHKAEDILETYMVDQMLSSSEGVSFTFSAPDLHQVIQQLDSTIELVVAKLMQGNKISGGTSSSSTRASILANTSSESVVVGVDADLLQLKDRLTGTQRKLEIVPIVGMGGIGKTALARKLYNDPLIISHFESRAWTTISQDYSTTAILSDLFHCIHEHDKPIEWDNLYKGLYGRRYLIVIDDIWSTLAWDDIRRYFPDNNNGSRIVITTRESDVAKYADSHTQQHHVQLLSRYESWNLLRQIVFGDDKCPDVLQGIGEKIASDCGGLPLALNVIGGLLSKVERSEDVWENIGNDVRAAIVEADKGFSNILYLSYNHLPNHLKPCFLYMGAFPEDHEINASRLICMWVAEGFVESKGDNNNDKSLEEEAEDYLKSLVERNLVMVRDYNDNGMPQKRYSMHDLLRDLCIRTAEEERFLHVVKNAPDVVTFSNLRRVSVHSSYGLENRYSSLEFMSLARSLIRTNSAMYKILSPNFFAVRLLRLLDLLGMDFKEFPRETFDLVNLRYLAVRCHSLVAGGISRLWSLQTLIVDATFGNVPSEVLEMLELRHLEIAATVLLASDVYTTRFVGEMKLHTIFRVELTRSLVKMGFFESIPSIRNLGIYCGDMPSGAIDLSHLLKLETLRWTSHLERNGCRFLPQLRLPCNLRSLTIGCCVLSSPVFSTLCALPNLEMLNLDTCVFESDAWEAAEGDEYRSLQYLGLTLPSLIHWRADETNFPRLRHLFLKSCWWLEEVPSGIGDIPTLEIIELKHCSSSAIASAVQMVEVQQSDYDNFDLQLRIT